MLFFGVIINAKFNALKTSIIKKALHGKGVVPRTYDKVLKLSGSWGNKSVRTRNNNSNAGVTMVQTDVLGRGDQGGRGRGRGRGGKNGQCGGAGCRRGGV